MLLHGAVEAHGARCLDGSPAGFYIERGSDPKRFVVHLQGGGWCVGPEGCALRAGFMNLDTMNTDKPLYQGIGSTELLADTTELYGAYYDSDPAVNPLMHN